MHNACELGVSKESCYVFPKDMILSYNFFTLTLKLMGCGLTMHVEQKLRVGSRMTFGPPGSVTSVNITSLEGQINGVNKQHFRLIMMRFKHITFET